MSSFQPLALAVNKRFNALSQHELFVAGADTDELWATYIASFPEGSNPIFKTNTEHECTCCGCIRTVMTIELQQRVAKIVGEQLGIDPATVKMESNFIADLGADSLDTIELVMALEDEFGIEIDDDTAEGLKTMSQVVEYIEKLPKT